MKILYYIAKTAHGFLLIGEAGECGLPINALSQVEPMMPKKSVIGFGVVQFYKEALQMGNVVMAIANSPAAHEKWVEEIEARVKERYASEYDRWWYGTDVGTSAATIFAVLAEPESRRSRGHEMSSGQSPRDSADFGRCLRLVAKFNWRERLSEVAAAFPDGLWPAIIARWDELATAQPVEQTKILSAIETSKTTTT